LTQQKSTFKKNLQNIILGLPAKLNVTLTPWENASPEDIKKRNNPLLLKSALVKPQRY